MIAVSTPGGMIAVSTPGGTIGVATPGRRIGVSTPGPAALPPRYGIGGTELRSAPERHDRGDQLIEAIL